MAAFDLTVDLLRSILSYDSDTGRFVWKPRPESMFTSRRSWVAWNARYANTPAGGASERNGGRVSMRIGSRSFYAHRLAWLYAHGAWPTGEIDHINGDPSDNRLINLRDVGRTLNQQNIRRRPAGTRPGLPLGVYFNARKVERAFSAHLRIDGRPTHLGYFDTAQEAHAAYLDAKRRHHLGCTL